MKSNLNFPDVAQANGELSLATFAALVPENKQFFALVSAEITWPWASKRPSRTFRT
ncbi:MAG: hypothetical protein K2P84_11660 [Undibacterium sp.]|nr:hypothetical protein [Undibacterium sp.]